MRCLDGGLTWSGQVPPVCVQGWSPGSSRCRGPLGRRGAPGSSRRRVPIRVLSGAVIRGGPPAGNTHLVVVCLVLRHGSRVFPGDAVPGVCRFGPRARPGVVAFPVCRLGPRVVRVVPFRLLRVRSPGSSWRRGLPAFLGWSPGSSWRRVHSGPLRVFAGVVPGLVLASWPSCCRRGPRARPGVVSLRTGLG